MSETVIRLVAVAIFALAGFLEARRFGREYGRTPFGWPAAVWAVVLGISLLVGCILLAIGERTGRAQHKKAAASAAIPGHGGYGQGSPAAPDIMPSRFQ